MTSKNIFCLACKFHLDKTVYMIEVNEHLVCPECSNSYPTDGISVLEAYELNWKDNAINVFFSLRPELNSRDLSNPKLFSLYMDCYHTLLIGRYNASIVMMGVLVEAIVKERIYLKRGIECTQPLGPCLNLIKKHKLMDEKDINFLYKFKKIVRNPYQHIDDKEIMRDIKSQIWEFKFNSLDEMKSQIESVRAGKIKPAIVNISEKRAILSIFKQEHDSKIVIPLFNEVYDFMLRCNLKYFNQHEWNEYHEKFRIK